MEKGYLYLRGLGGSLFWGTKKDIRFFSRRELELIDISKISLIRPAAQAVLAAAKCPGCGMIAFQAFPSASQQGSLSP